ncbi:MAG: ComF family protein [Candidatus Marinimicrobia bacterium]|nr:ComF family protein [Candidatus Neomarinimicrobiota bacterium]
MTTMPQPAVAMLELLFPSLCVTCEQPVEPGRHLCEPCGSALSPSNLGNWLGHLTTGAGLDGAWSAFWFDDRLQRAIHGLKYDGRKGLAVDLVRHACTASPSAELRRAYDVLIPVPLHRTKLRERGYNQAALLAHALGTEWGLPVESEAVRRRQWTVSQTGLTAGQRIGNMAGSFECRLAANGTRALLIDDVVTTGATASACAQVLKGAGYSLVGVFSIATPPTEH